MAEYIEREAAIRFLLNDSPEQVNYSREDAADCIRYMNAADVAPVVHGRWDDSGRYTFPNGETAVRCTICGCALNESEYHLYDWNYCPICGAKMDECNEPENEARH